MDQIIMELTQLMVYDLKHNKLPIDVDNMVPWLQAEYYRSRDGLANAYVLPGYHMQRMVAIKTMIDTLVNNPDQV